MAILYLQQRQHYSSQFMSLPESSSCFPCRSTLEIYEDISHHNKRPQRCLQLISNHIRGANGKQNENLINSSRKNKKSEKRSILYKGNNNQKQTNKNEHQTQQKEVWVVEDVPIEKVIYRRNAEMEVPRDAVHFTYAPIRVERIISSQPTNFRLSEGEDRLGEAQIQQTQTPRHTFMIPPLQRPLFTPQPNQIQMQPTISFAHPQKNDFYIATQPTSYYDGSFSKSITPNSQYRPSLPANTSKLEQSERKQDIPRQSLRSREKKREQFEFLDLFPQNNGFHNTFTNQVVYSDRPSRFSAPMFGSPHKNNHLIENKHNLSPTKNKQSLQKKSPPKINKKQIPSNLDKNNKYHTNLVAIQRETVTPPRQISQRQKPHMTPIIQSTQQNRHSSLYQGGRTIVSRLQRLQTTVISRLQTTEEVDHQSNVVFRYAPQWKIDNPKQFNLSSKSKHNNNCQSREILDKQEKEGNQDHIRQDHIRQDHIRQDHIRQNTEGRQGFEEQSGPSGYNRSWGFQHISEEEGEDEESHQFTLVSIDPPTPRTNSSHIRSPNHPRTSTTLIASLLPQIAISHAPNLIMGQLIGVGRFSQVYLCRESLSGAIFAMKQVYFIIKQIFKRTIIVHKIEEEVDKYIAGAGVGAGQGIVEVYGVFQTEDRVCIMMEYCGKTLFQEILHQGPLPINKCISYLKSLITALVTLHSQNIAHGNLSLSHILLTLSQIKIKFISNHYISLQKTQNQEIPLDNEGDTTFNNEEEMNALETARSMRMDAVDVGIAAWRMINGLQLEGEKVYERQKKYRDLHWRYQQSQLVIQQIQSILSAMEDTQNNVLKHYNEVVLMLLQQKESMSTCSHLYFAHPLFSSEEPTSFF